MASNVRTGREVTVPCLGPSLRRTVAPGIQAILSFNSVEERTVWPGHGMGWVMEGGASHPPRPRPCPRPRPRPQPILSRPINQSIHPSFGRPASQTDGRTDRQLLFRLRVAATFPHHTSPKAHPSDALPYLTTFASTLLSLFFFFFFHSPPRSFARSLLLDPD